MAINTAGIPKLAGFDFERSIGYKPRVQFYNALLDKNDGKLPEFQGADDSGVSYYKSHDGTTGFRIYTSEEGNLVIQQGTINSGFEEIKGPSLDISADGGSFFKLGESSAFHADGSMMWISKETGDALKGSASMDIGKLELNFAKNGFDVKKSLLSFDGEFEVFGSPSPSFDADGNLHAEISHIGVKVSSGGSVIEGSITEDGFKGGAGTGNLKVTFGTNDSDSSLSFLSGAQLEQAGIDGCNNDIKVFQEHNYPMIDGKPVPFRQGQFNDKIEALEGRKEELLQSQQTRNDTIEEYNTKIDNLDVSPDQKELLKNSMYNKIHNAHTNEVTDEAFSNGMEAQFNTLQAEPMDAAEPVVSQANHSTGQEATTAAEPGSSQAEAFAGGQSAADDAGFSGTGLLEKSELVKENASELLENINQIKVMN